jgi:hypothetical protein
MILSISFSSRVLLVYARSIVEWRTFVFTLRYPLKDLSAERDVVGIVVKMELALLKTGVHPLKCQYMYMHEYRTSRV